MMMRDDSPAEALGKQALLGSFDGKVFLVHLGVVEPLERGDFFGKTWLPKYFSERQFIPEALK